MEKWIFQKHLGTGVSGYAVLAQDGEERRAVKIPKLATSDTTHANMPRGKMEGDVLEVLTHKNIVRLIQRCTGPLPDAFVSVIPQSEKPSYTRLQRNNQRRPVTVLVMEYQERKLFDFVKGAEGGADYVKIVLRVLCGLVSAAEHMLSRGFLHLDLKGDNVMVDADGEPIVIDFGHVTTYSCSKDVDCIPHEFLGNEMHTPPELMSTKRKGRPCPATSGEKVIVFAVGVLLAECLGAHPFETYDEGTYTEGTTKFVSNIRTCSHIHMHIFRGTGGVGSVYSRQKSRSMSAPGGARSMCGANAPD